MVNIFSNTHWTFSTHTWILATHCQALRSRHGSACSGEHHLAFVHTLSNNNPIPAQWKGKSFVSVQEIYVNDLWLNNKPIMLMVEARHLREEAPCTKLFLLVDLEADPLLVLLNHVRPLQCTAQLLGLHSGVYITTIGRVVTPSIGHPSFFCDLPHAWRTWYRKDITNSTQINFIITITYKNWHKK